MDGFNIVMDKELVDTDLLLMSDPSLPQVMRQLNQCSAFVGVLGGRAVAVCLMDKKDRYYDIVNLAVAPQHRGKGYGRELLTYVMDYVQVQGGRYIEIGAGNANIPMFALFQRLGFRVVGVWPDYYLEDTTQQGEEGILNRDMLRYRLDLQELEEL